MRRRCVCVQSTPRTQGRSLRKYVTYRRDYSDALSPGPKLYRWGNETPSFLDVSGRDFSASSQRPRSRRAVSAQRRSASAGRLRATSAERGRGGAGVVAAAAGSREYAGVRERDGVVAAAPAETSLADDVDSSYVDTDMVPLLDMLEAAASTRDVAHARAEVFRLLANERRNRDRATAALRQAEAEKARLQDIVGMHARNRSWQIRGYKAAKDVAEEARGGAEAAAHAAEAAQGELLHELQEAHAELLRRDERIGELEAQLQQNANTLTTERAVAARTIAELRGSLDDANAEVGVLKAQLAVAESRVTALEASDAEKRQKIARLEQGATRAQETIDALKEQVQFSSAQNKELGERCSRSQSEALAHQQSLLLERQAVCQLQVCRYAR